MQILIIQTAFIGDVILTTPLVEILKEYYPESELDFLTIPASQNIIESNPGIRNTIIFDKKGRDRGLNGLKTTARHLSSVFYDICLTPHRSWRSAFLTRKTNAKIRAGFDRSASPRAFTHLQTYRQDIHEIERNLSLLNALELKADIRPPRIFPTDADRKIVEEKIKPLNVTKSRNLFALAPGSVWPTKRWPSEYYADLTRRIENMGYQIILVGGPQDRNLCQYIKNAGHSVISLAGELSLRQTYYLLTKCCGLVSNDSAPLHLGSAAQISVYGVFGATVPAFGFAPVGQDSVVFENKNLACRPCGIHGGHKCPTKTFDCMNTVKPEYIEALIMNQRGPDIHE